MSDKTRLTPKNPEAASHPSRLAGKTMKPVQFYSAYGYRAKIGLIVPSTNTVMEPEFYRMAPTGISIHTARMMLLGKATHESYEKMEDDTARAASELATAEPELIVWGCTSGSVICPSERIVSRIENAAHIEAITTIDAVMAALEAVGARNVALGTPYVEFVNEAEVRFLEDAGYKVPRWHGLQLGETQEERRGIARVPPSSLERLVRYIDCDEADTIFLSCTNLATVDVIEELEAAVGKPVITSNQATFWHALRTLGIKDRIEGRGRLLREH